MNYPVNKTVKICLTSIFDEDCVLLSKYYGIEVSQEHDLISDELQGEIEKYEITLLLESFFNAASDQGWLFEEEENVREIIEYDEINYENVISVLKPYIVEISEEEEFKPLRAEIDEEVKSIKNSKIDVKKIFKSPRQKNQIGNIYCDPDDIPEGWLGD